MCGAIRDTSHETKPWICKQPSKQAPQCPFIYSLFLSSPFTHVLTHPIAPLYLIIAYLAWRVRIPKYVANILLCTTVLLCKHIGAEDLGNRVVNVEHNTWPVR
jgi:hypothetical protein